MDVAIMEWLLVDWHWAIVLPVVLIIAMVITSIIRGTYGVL